LYDCYDCIICEILALSLNGHDVLEESKYTFKSGCFGPFYQRS